MQIQKVKFCILSCLTLAFGLSSCHHCYRSYPYALNRTNINCPVAEAFSTQSVQPGELIYEQWWEFFQDAQLNRFIEIALSCHPDIKMAEARIRFACQQARVARSVLYPHLFGVGDIEPQKVSKFSEGFFPGAPETFTEVTLELTTAAYELDLWKKNRSLFYAAVDEMQASIADFEEAKLLLATTIASVYFDWQWQFARKEVTQERLEARQELLSLLKQQFDLGIISEFRIYEIDTEVQLLKDMILQLDGQIKIDEHALAALVSNVAAECCTQAPLALCPASRFDTPFPLPTTLPIDLLARRPDITASIWRAQAACFNVKAARANFMPRLDLMAWVGTQSLRLSKLFTGDTLIAGGDAVATLPIFLAGKLQGELGEARENVEIAIDTYNQTVLNAVQQVSDALSDLQYADERNETVRRSIQDAQLLYDLTKQKFESAIYNKLTVLNALENLLIQKDLEVQIQLSRFEAAVELIRAIGGGYYYDCP